MSASKSRLRYIQGRLDELDRSGAVEPLSADLLAEQSLLRSLAATDDQLLATDGPAQRQLQKASNSNAMFDATLRAVSERRSDRLDESASDIIRAEAHSKRAEMDKVRAEAREKVLQIALDGQAKFAAELVGLLARCTVMMGQGSATLNTTFGESPVEGEDTSVAIARQVAESMSRVAQSNDQAFASLIGATTASFQSARDSALLKFTAIPSTTNTNARPGPRGSITGRPKPPARTSLTNHRRRSSLTVSHNSPRRLNPKSPRRPTARHSLSRAPVSRIAEKKSVRWRDETSQGEIDDKGLRPIRRSVSQPTKSLTPLLLVPKPDAKGRDGSEAEWEDEQTEDSMSVSSTSSHATVTGTSTSQTSNNRGIRDRLLRAPRPSPMASLGEETEGEDSPLKPKRSPLGEVMNSPPANHSDGSPSKKQKQKSQARPATPPNSASPSKAARPAPVPGSVSKHSRRVSSVGPQRGEKKSRRRSSLIPRPSPPSAAFSYAYTQPRKTPSKKRRVSAMTEEGNSSSALWVKPARPAFSQSVSVDMSSTAGARNKPVWR